MKDSDEIPDNGPADAVCAHDSYSPPCYLREVASPYAGYLTKHELLEFLNELLEGERAGERAVVRLMAESGENALHLALGRAAIAQARFCAMLSRHIRELGGIPSPATAVFYDSLMAIHGLGERLAFLNQRQAWRVRRLREVLPAIGDGRLYDDLRTVLRFHEASVRRCDRLLTKPLPARPKLKE
jgi:hypothetical protein